MPPAMSGSSAKAMVLVHRKNCARSSSGTPNSSRIAIRGSSAATSSTNSHSPRDATRSIISFACSRSQGSMAATALGVNASFTIRRCVTCFGGSMAIKLLAFMILVTSRAVSSGGSMGKGPSTSDEKSAGFCETKSKASRFTAAQYGTPVSGSS